MSRDFVGREARPDSPIFNGTQKVPILNMLQNGPDERDRDSDRSGNRMCLLASSDDISGMLEIGQEVPGDEHREEETGTLDRNALR
jgi:hypothetical protein